MEGFKETRHGGQQIEYKCNFGGKARAEIKGIFLDIWLI